MSTRHYVRLEPDDRRYWHWWIARRDRLDVHHNGDWYALLEWKELLEGPRPYPVEATLVLRSELAKLENAKRLRKLVVRPLISSRRRARRAARLALREEQERRGKAKS